MYMPSEDVILKVYFLRGMPVERVVSRCIIFTNGQTWSKLILLGTQSL